MKHAYTTTIRKDDQFEANGIPVPEDLARAIAGVQGGLERFEKLSPSMRKEFVRKVESTKAQETRGRRIAKIVEQLSR